MGGGRCCYRDCCQKNDGVTHMFRVPVFDKIRCYKWLVNAQRADLLDLKVSQVKNKQICQHHFPDDDFMNEKRNSLKPSAIPTLDGPYVSEDEKDIDDSNLAMLSSQIEPEILLPRNVKPELLDGKLIDFLTVGDMDYLESTPHKIVGKRTQKNDIESYYYLKRFQAIKENPRMIQQTKSADKYKIKQPSTPMAHDILKNSVSPYKIIHKESNGQNNSSNNNASSISKVTILAQKKIVSPIKNVSTIKMGQLQPVNLKSHLTKNRANIDDIKMTPEEIKKLVDKENSLLIEKEGNKSLKIISFLEPQPVLEQVLPQVNNNPITNNKIVTSSDLNPPIMPSEKTADIEGKRIFNRKLRDIISESIDAADSKNTVSTQAETIKTVINEAPCPDKKQKVDKIGTVSAITQLENRIKIMEKLLMNRIDSTTKEVHDLKKMLEAKNKEEMEAKKLEKELKKEDITDEHRKKRLYTEISNYLSKEAKSALYEELFLSNFRKRKRTHKI